MTQDIAATRDISTKVLRRYLTMNGWVARTLADGQLALFTLHGDQDDDIEIVLSMVAEESRTASGVHAALRTLSQLQDRPIEDVVQEVRSIAFDILKSKVPDEYVIQDSVELRLAAEYVEGMKTFLASAATTELKPDRYYGRTRKEASDYAGRCRFGHTFRGSFGFVVESPVGLNDEPTILDVEQELPFSRRVVQRIARGLRAIQQAAAEEDPLLIVRQYASGLNANMCDDIVDIIEKTGIAKLSVEIDFSPEWPTAQDLSDRPKFTVELRHAELLREAARTLRAEEAAREVVVTGRIKRLATEGNPADLLQDNSDREIVVHWDSPDNGVIRVRVFLAPQEYLVAVEAHAAGRFVSIRGSLEHRGRTWTMETPTDLTVLPF